jgi:hypothetical protein
LYSLYRSARVTSVLLEIPMTKLHYIYFLGTGSTPVSTRARMAVWAMNAAATEALAARCMR